MTSPSGARSLIPRSFIDELLNRTDLVELIDGYVPLKKSGSSHVACCPFHNEKSPSFNVSAKKQFYHCFGCSSSGNAISFVMNYLGQGFVEALETLAARLGMTVPRDSNSEKTEQTLSLYQLLDRVSLFYQKKLKHSGIPAVNYLRERGFNGETAKQFQLGYAPPEWNGLEKQFREFKPQLITTGMLIQKDDGNTYDRYRHRIIFPIHNRNGRIIGFGGRAIDAEQKPKYLNSPETLIFQKNRELYGLYHILQQKNPIQNILIVEGYLDVISLAQHGISNAVAALGTATSTYHIQLLSRHTKQLIFCFDGDAAGRAAAWRALENTLPQMNDGLDARFVFLPENHDPDSLVRAEGSDAFRSRIAGAIPLSQYFLDTITADIDVHSVAGKSQLLNVARPFLETMAQGSYRQLIINELSRMTRIENHRILQMISSRTTTDTPAARGGGAMNRSPVLLATALLIQHPEIYEACKMHIRIESLQGKDQEVLRSLLQQTAENPGISTASLLELWRDTEFFESLGTLAGRELLNPEETLEKEFIDTILFLEKQNIEKKINELIAKSRKQGLTVSERVILQDMLKQRHRVS